MSFKQVNKTVARKMYDAGYEIQLLQCKVNPAVALDPTAQGIFWINPVPIQKDDPDHIVQYREGRKTRRCEDFDTVVNNFEYYNCCGELGNYAHYFVKQEDYDEWRAGVQTAQKVPV